MQCVWQRKIRPKIIEILKPSSQAFFFSILKHTILWLILLETNQRSNLGKNAFYFGVHFIHCHVISDLPTYSPRKKILNSLLSAYLLEGNDLSENNVLSTHSVLSMIERRSLENEESMFSYHQCLTQKCLRKFWETMRLLKKRKKKHKECLSLLETTEQNEANETFQCRVNTKQCKISLSLIICCKLHSWKNEP